MPAPRALLWDNDGILVDTEGVYYEACRTVLAGWGIELSREQHLEISLGQGQSVFGLALQAGASESEVLALRAARDQLYAELIGQGVAPIPGVAAVVELLAKRLPMGVVTSCLPQHFRLIHQRRVLLDHFQLIWTPDKYLHHKPHPEPYLTAAAALGVDPARCVVIEDSPRGIKSARAAGMYCAAVRSQFAGDGVSLADANVVLGSVSELPGLLASLGLT